MKLASAERTRILNESKKIDKKGFSIATSVAKSLGVSEEVLSNQILVVE